MLKRLYDWLGIQVHKPYAIPFLGVLFFIEAIFFVPVDPLFMLFCIERRNQAFYLAGIATCASVLGGIVGYFLGFGIWETVGQKLVNLVLTQATFDSAVARFEEYQSWAVLIAGFTPLPYKAVTLAAGFCQLPLIPFIINSCIARGARFFLVAGIIYIWGERIKEYIDRYFNILVLLFVIILFAALWFIT